MSARSGIVRGALGILVSVVAIALVVRTVDVEETARVIGAAMPAWIVVLYAFQLVDGLSRGVRWQRLLAPVARIRLARTLDYLYLGYLANNVLPARLGELVRSHYLGDREGVSRTTTLGTVVVERVVDTTMLVLVAAAGIAVLGVRGSVATAVVVGLGISAFLVVGLAVALVAHRIPGADRLLGLVARQRRLAGVAASLRGGLAVAADPRTLATVVGLSLVAWAAATVQMLAAGRAIGVELTVAQGALLMAGAALSTAIPSGPGYLGTYELAAVAVGSALGVPAEKAFALAVIVHFGALSATTIGGLVGFARAWRRPAAVVAEAGSPTAS